MIHLYHGDGKGKTTAAMGLALRAAGNGWRVVIVQFLKGAESGEVAPLHALPNVTVLRDGNSEKFSFQMDEAERAAALAAHSRNLQAARALTQGAAPALLVLDEALDALATGLLREEDLRALLAGAPEALELVFTGRNPPPFLLEAADYITEMRCGRHPYDKGVPARKGVEY